MKVEVTNDHRMEVMLNEAFRYEENNIMDGSNVNAEVLYNMIQATQQPLYEGCSIAGSYLLL